jgi:GrpB-like predicted nucleotidyltransferase (UPF0157 family)
MKNSAPPAEFGLNRGELRLVAVGPEWALRYAAEQQRLHAALGAAVVDIQHVGSTAILRILAKPILDIAVAIEAFEDGHLLVSRIEGLGYAYRGENGVQRRHYFVRGTPRRTHHLHMLEHHSADWERHIRFRDRLLASPALAATYSQVKLSCASRAFGNRDRYQSLKSCFIAQILDSDARG